MMKPEHDVMVALLQKLPQIEAKEMANTFETIDKEALLLWLTCSLEYEFKKVCYRKNTKIIKSNPFGKNQEKGE